MHVRLGDEVRELVGPDGMTRNKALSADLKNESTMLHPKTVTAILAFEQGKPVQAHRFRYHRLRSRPRWDIVSAGMCRFLHILGLLLAMILPFEAIKR